MSTRCAIGLLRPNGTVLTIYNHHDGYPSGVGVCLLESYANEERIKALLELGSISSIGKYLSKEEQPKDAEHDDICDPYCLGEFEETTQIMVYPNKEKFTWEAIDDMDADYLYLFEGGRWLVYCQPWGEPGADWYDLKEILEKEKKSE